MTGQCEYFVPRKKRLCRMTVRPGKHYCGEHEPPSLDSNEIPDLRVPCPLDPKHTCYKSKLEKHLKICNARITEQPPFIVKNINVPEHRDVPAKKPLKDICEDVILELIEKINTVHEKVLANQIESIPTYEIHSSIQSDYQESNRGHTSLRHLVQSSQLLNIMEKEGLVNDDSCYVEMGAGRGQLTEYLCNAYCTDETRSVCVCVERASRRHTRDTRIADRSTRIRADIAHLKMADVPQVGGKRCVMFAKHLCGVATDYTLRCLADFSTSNQNAGIVLATCCHHQCQLLPYVGHKYFNDLGITDTEFNIMLGLVSWATCGDGRSRNKKEKLEETDSTNDKESLEHEITDFTDDRESKMADSRISEKKIDQNENLDKSAGSQQNDHYKLSLLSRQIKESVGRKSKELIDWGRVQYLKECGFDARLCYYVPKTESLENVCIVAKINR